MLAPWCAPAAVCPCLIAWNSTWASSLEGAASGLIDAAQLRHAAGQIAAGDAASPDGAVPGWSAVVGRAAMADGFGDVVLYGAPPSGCWPHSAFSLSGKEGSPCPA